MTFAVTLGDVTGIGPEIVGKALAEVLDEDDTQYVVFGNSRHWEGVVQQWLPDRTVEEWIPGTLPEGRIAFTDSGVTLPMDLVPGDARAGAAALDWLTSATHACLAGSWAGMITAPLCKAGVLRSGKTGFVGQTEFLAGLTGSSRFAMMLLGHDEQDRWLRVALTTIHLPLVAVPAAVTQEAVGNAIALADQACRLLGLPRRRIGVCGLNPHAGEEGMIGREEIEIIAPAIRTALGLGLDVGGPIPADTLFHRARFGDFDAVVAQYHDQGLAPLKLMAFDNGINWTLGLPFIRMSPDHGTAHDIAGLNRANPESLISAFRLARRVARGSLPYSAMQ